MFLTLFKKEKVCAIYLKSFIIMFADIRVKKFVVLVSKISRFCDLLEYQLHSSELGAICIKWDGLTPSVVKLLLFVLLIPFIH